MIACPKCKQQATLYKEILPDGLAKLHCQDISCGWVSSEVDHHLLYDTQTMKEVKEVWR